MKVMTKKENSHLLLQQSLKERWKKYVRALKKNSQIYILVLPVVIFFLIFMYGPMYGAVIAFLDYKPAKGISGSNWVGLKYFIRYFEDPYFFRTIRNTVLISLYQILFSMPCAIMLALLINEIKNTKFKKLVQTITYLPHFISLVVVCGMLKEFLGSDGVITQFLGYFGMEPKNLLMVPEYYRIIHVVSGIWQTVGWNSIVYLAALTSIDTQQYEAAELDGAGRFQKMRYITIPGILPTITIMFIMNLGKVMSVGYEKIILLSNPATYEKAQVVSSYVYQVGLAGSYPQFSYATAIGLFQSVVNLVLVLLGNKICRKLNGSGLW